MYISWDRMKIYSQSIKYKQIDAETRAHAHYFDYQGGERNSQTSGRLFTVLLVTMSQVDVYIAPNSPVRLSISQVS